ILAAAVGRAVAPCPFLATVTQAGAFAPGLVAPGPVASDALASDAMTSGRSRPSQTEPRRTGAGLDEPGHTGADRTEPRRTEASLGNPRPSVPGQTGALAFAEGAGWSTGDIATTASFDGSGWVLSGAKSFVPDGDRADVLVVVARLPGTVGDAGLGAFLVDPSGTTGSSDAAESPGTTKLSDAPGWSVASESSDTPGSSSSTESSDASGSVDAGDASSTVFIEPLQVIDPTVPLARVRLVDHRVEADAVVIDPRNPDASAVVAQALLHATTMTAVSCVATCRRIFELTLDHARSRHQFGRPIGSFQAIKHRLANLYLAVERAHALAWAAVDVLAEAETPAGAGAEAEAGAEIHGRAAAGTRPAAEARDPRASKREADAEIEAATEGECEAEAELEPRSGAEADGMVEGEADRRTVAVAVAVAAAKIAADQCSRFLTSDGLQLHGAIGFIAETDLHLWLKRAVTMSALFGDATVHRADLAHLLGLTGETRSTTPWRPRRIAAPSDPFRAEVRAWIAANRPDAEVMVADPSISTGHAPAWARAWTRRLFDAGLLLPGRPAAFGGRDATEAETLIVREELALARLPRSTNVQGLGIVAQSIIDHGTDDQIERYALAVLHGEKTACLGMSEPDAGSDLASLRTRACLVGDRWIIDGQKVWTSGANYADFCLLFCRTEPDAAKHAGISILLVDLDTPGVTVRPLPEITHPEFPDLNEVFFDAVSVPAGALLGTRGQGWAITNTSLAHERNMVWVNGVLAIDEAVDRLLAEAPARLATIDDPIRRTLLADRVVGVTVDAAGTHALGYRSFAKLAAGGDAPEQALMKLFASEVRRDVAGVGADLAGTGALVIGDAPLDGHQAIDEPQGTWLEQWFGAFANTISAGTSEIQRNIIAERVLGLPREPAPAPAPNSTARPGTRSESRSEVGGEP
ncbi:MAG: acyl-CoA dehydrogenase family protein, partial [Actinobacteria bacterium]|nr:acyl-CoA dehydrogenase family protein [Actinomycetota bacterium]